MSRQILAVFALLTVTSATSAASFTRLGQFAGHNYSVATGVSADGSVVVGHGTSSLGVTEAFRWTNNTGIVGLGDLPGGSFWSAAKGVSADGAVIIGYSDYAWGGGYEGFIWRDSSGLVALGFPADADSSSYPHAISDDGTIVVGHAVGSSTIVPRPFVGYRWTSAEGYLTWESFFPSGISGDGSTIVGESVIGLDQAAAYWTRSAGIVLLAHLAGYADGAKAVGASINGTVIVGSEYGNDGIDLAAFRWRAPDGMVNLGFLPGMTGSGATAISADGTIIIGSSFTDFDHDSEAFVWTQTQGMRRLIDVLSENGVADVEGWTLEHATDISSDGHWVVGYGLNPSGYEEAFLANISPFAEPDSDGDGIVNSSDNCTLVASVDQYDADDDGYGNVCDADLNNNGVTNAQDYAIFRAGFGTSNGAADLDGNGVVDTQDYELLRTLLGSPPGPSGLHP